MPKTTPCPTCTESGTSSPLISTRRSCPGCGMSPGKLHNNGLCVDCQHPAEEPADPEVERLHQQDLADRDREWWSA